MASDAVLERKAGEAMLYARAMAGVTRGHLINA